MHNHNGNPQSGGPVVDVELKCVSSWCKLTSLFNIPGCSVRYKNDNGAFPDGEHKALPGSSLFYKCHTFSRYKGKAIPICAWGGPQGSRRFRLPDYKTIGIRGWYGCLPYAPAAFTPILLETESTPGPKCGRKDYVNAKFQWHHRESNPRPSDL